jgi:hypothetical protein
MILNSESSIQGVVSIVKTNAKNEVTDKVISNLVVSSGKTIIATLLSGGTGAMTHMAVGSGTTAAVIADVALESQISNRVALTSTTPATNTVTYVATFAPGVSTGNLTEAGLFNDATNTTTAMLARTVFPLITKEAADTITITWVITIS